MALPSDQRLDRESRLFGSHSLVYPEEMPGAIALGLSNHRMCNYFHIKSSIRHYYASICH
jgi:hypothetical protein